MDVRTYLMIKGSGLRKKYAYNYDSILNMDGLRNSARQNQQDISRLEKEVADAEAALNQQTQNVNNNPAYVNRFGRTATPQAKQPVQKPGMFSSIGRFFGYK